MIECKFKIDFCSIHFLPAVYHYIYDRSAVESCRGIRNSLQEPRERNSFSGSTNFCYSY